MSTRNNIPIAITLTLISMGLFSFSKKSPAQASSIDPYKDSATNTIYKLLFCDNLNLYKEKTQKPYTYPFDVLFSEESSAADLQKIIDDGNADPRIKILAYNRLQAGINQQKKSYSLLLLKLGLTVGLMFWLPSKMVRHVT